MGPHTFCMGLPYKIRGKNPVFSRPVSPQRLRFRTSKCHARAPTGRLTYRRPTGFRIKTLLYPIPRTGFTMGHHTKSTRASDLVFFRKIDFLKKVRESFWRLLRTGRCVDIDFNIPTFHTHREKGDPLCRSVCVFRIFGLTKLE
jgi:hypothetical protein